MKDDLTEQTMQQHLVYQGRIINLYCDDVQLPNGNMGKREYVTHRGGAAILPVDDQGNVYLVRQHRYAYHENILEIPAGKLEAGEDPATTAKRELEEEIGMLCTELVPYGMLYPTPGYTNEHLYVYLAKGLSQGNVHLDEDEFVHTVTLPFDAALRMVLSGEIHDAKTCYAILRYAQERK